MNKCYVPGYKISIKGKRLLDRLLLKMLRVEFVVRTNNSMKITGDKK